MKKKQTPTPPHVQWNGKPGVIVIDGKLIAELLQR